MDLKVIFKGGFQLPKADEQASDELLKFIINNSYYLEQLMHFS